MDWWEVTKYLLRQRWVQLLIAVVLGLGGGAFGWNQLACADGGIYGGVGLFDSTGSAMLMGQYTVPKTEGHARLILMGWSDNNASNAPTNVSTSSEVVCTQAQPDWYKDPPPPPVCTTLTSTSTSLGNPQSTANVAAGAGYFAMPWKKGNWQFGGGLGFVYTGETTPNLDKRENFFLQFEMRYKRWVFLPIVHLSSTGSQPGENFMAFGHFFQTK